MALSATAATVPTLVLLALSAAVILGLGSAGVLLLVRAASAPPPTLAGMLRLPCLP